MTPAGLCWCDAFGLYEWDSRVRLAGCSVGQISEEVAQEALIELVSRTRCYGTSAAREMDIYRIVPSCALHVIIFTHWLYAGLSCRHAHYQYWLFAGQCKISSRPTEITIYFWEKKWRFAWML